MRFTFENLAEGTATQFLYDFEATFKDFLVLLQHSGVEDDVKWGLARDVLSLESTSNCGLF